MINEKNQHSFCILPWLHAHATTRGKVLPCCSYDDLQHGWGYLHKRPLSEIVNGPEAKEMRQQMMNGIRPDGCRKCWWHEDGATDKYLSRRQYYNELFQNRIDEGIPTDADGHIPNWTLRYWDARESNVCNFACRTCNPSNSTAWIPDWNALNTTHRKLKHFVIKDANAFNDIRSSIKDVDRVYFAGGEPLLMPDHWSALQELIDTGRAKDVDLEISTNLSTLTFKKQHVFDLWKHFKTVNIRASVDDIGHRAEYTRHGTKWSVVEGNLFDIIDNLPNAMVSIIHTMSAYNIYYVPEMVDWLQSRFQPRFKGQRHRMGGWTANLVSDPINMTFEVLDPVTLEEIYWRLEDTLPRFKQHMSRNYQNVAFLQKRIKATTHSVQLAREFKEFTFNLDSIRGESFHETFPEMKTFHEYLRTI